MHMTGLEAYSLGKHAFTGPSNVVNPLVLSILNHNINTSECAKDDQFVEHYSHKNVRNHCESLDLQCV